MSNATLENKLKCLYVLFHNVREGFENLESVTNDIDATLEDECKPSTDLASLAEGSKLVCDTETEELLEYKLEEVETYLNDILESISEFNSAA